MGEKKDEPPVVSGSSVVPSRGASGQPISTSEPKSSEDATTISVSGIPKSHADALSIIANMKGTTRSDLVKTIFEAWFKSDMSLKETLDFVKAQADKLKIQGQNVQKAERQRI